jgi:hypothetical protein
MDFIALVEEKLGEIRAILSGNAGDQSSFHPGCPMKSRRAV